MGEFGVIAFIGAAAGLLVAFGILAIFGNKKKNEQITAFVDQRGWTHTRSDNTIGQTWEWGPFAESGTKVARDVLTGTIAFSHVNGATKQVTPVRCYQFDIEGMSSIGESMSSSTTELQVVEVEAPHGWPEVHLQLENVWSRRFGKDIQLGDLEFDKKWQVKGPQEQAIVRLLDARVRADLMGERHKGLNYDFFEGKLYVWRNGVQRLDHIDPMIAAAQHLFELLPRG